MKKIVISWSLLVTSITWAMDLTRLSTANSSGLMGVSNPHGITYIAYDDLKPLQAAIAKKDNKTVKLLTKQNKKLGELLARVASSNGDLQALIMLDKAGVNVLNYDDQGNSTLSFAIRNKQNQVIDWLHNKAIKS